MQWFVKKEDVLGEHQEYEQMLDLNNFKIKLFVCKTYLDMRFSGFQNKEYETNRSLTMPKLQVQTRSEITAWVSHVVRKMQITSKARSISTNEMNEGFATWNSDSWNLHPRVVVHWRACSRLLPVVLARAHGKSRVWD